MNGITDEFVLLELFENVIQSNQLSTVSKTKAKNLFIAKHWADLNMTDPCKTTLPQVNHPLQIMYRSY